MADAPIVDAKLYGVWGSGTEQWAIGEKGRNRRHPPPLQAHSGIHVFPGPQTVEDLQSKAFLHGSPIFPPAEHLPV